MRILIFIFVLACNQATASTKDILCLYDFDKISGFKYSADLSSKLIESYGTGFVANKKQAFIRRYVNGKLGPKEQVVVSNEALGFASYYLHKKDNQSKLRYRIQFRTYDDGRCYLHIMIPKFEPMWIRGKIK